jgi:response regulator RpfG family c-di-GMP phosphodiesterase
MPVILTSGHSTQETIEEAEALGIHHYLKKPFTPQELIGSIRKVLKPPPGGVPDPVISKEGFSAPKPDIAFRDSA